MALGRLAVREATIASGAALSSAIRMTGMKLIAIIQPADCEGTAFGLQASYDGGVTCIAVYNTIQEATGAAPVSALWEVTKSATVAQWLNLSEPFRIMGPTHIKLQSENGSNAAANQTTADATITVILEELDDPN
jgi:hypothetical protein